MIAIHFNEYIIGTIKNVRTFIKFKHCRSRRIANQKFTSYIYIRVYITKNTVVAKYTYSFNLTT